MTLGSFIGGRLGGLYESLTGSQFWCLHAACVGAGGGLLLIIGRRMGSRFVAAEAPLPEPAPS